MSHLRMLPRTNIRHRVALTDCARAIVHGSCTQGSVHSADPKIARLRHRLAAGQTNAKGMSPHMKRSLLPQRIRTLCLAVFGSSITLSAGLQAQESQADAAQTGAASSAEVVGEVTVVQDRLEVLPTTPVESVFGFGKTVLETPRSLTTISNEMMNKTIITEIDDLVALTPGSFTQSFFGVAGSLDVRGTPGETYFRGVKRIENPGNYPT